MPEKGSSINMNSLETRFTVGKVEKPIEQKIEDTAKKIISEDIFNTKKDQFATEYSINRKADGIVESLGTGFSTYKDMMDAMNDPNRPAIKDKATETYDVLRKSVSVAMNVDQETQTRLNLGASKVAEVLPKSWNFVHPRTPEMNLAEGVIDVTITNPDILKSVKQLDKFRGRVDVSVANERNQFAEKVESEVGKLLFMEVPEDKEDELMAVKSFLNTEAGILRGELGTKDNSADKEDVTAVLGEKLAQAAEKMGQAAEKMADTAKKTGENQRNDNKNQNKKDNRTTADDSEESLERKNSLTIDQINQLLDQIENSFHSSNDITYNSNRARILDGVMTGQKKVADINGEIIDPKKDEASKDRMNEIRETIMMRKYLNDIFLEMSKVHDVQTAIKVQGSFHEGDTEHTWDQQFISFFLRDGAGGLPVDKAWDLRQDAYFKYCDPDSKTGMLYDIEKNNPELLEKYKIDKDEFLDVSPAFVKNTDFGIDKTYYMNFRCETNSRRSNVVKDYMVQQIVKERKCSEDDAKKAVELAKRLSVATMQDSAANIGLADGDSYAELILLKFFRFQDSVDTGGGKKEGKGKQGTGSERTIKYIESLTPPWLVTAAKKEGGKVPHRDIWKPLYAKEIDPDRISGKSDMLFHLNSIVDKQVGAFKDLILKPSSPKNAAPEIMENVYSRINKAVSEAKNAGWDVLSVKENDLRGDESLETLQRLVRARIIAGMVHTAGREGTEWNQYSLYKFLKWAGSPLFPDKDGKKTVSFISKPQIEWIRKSYKTNSLLAWSKFEDKILGGK